MEHYWHLELYGGEIIKIKPDPQKIKLIQDHIANQTGAITTPTRSIIIKDVKDFRLSDEIYTDKKLLEEVNQAFNEPTYSEAGIRGRMVKKSVPRRMWERHYKYIPAYKLLFETDSRVEIAFTLPSNQIDHERVQELSADDLVRLSR